MLSYPYRPARNGGGGPTIVTWADGTGEQIKRMIDAANAGEIDLTDYWSVGETRNARINSFKGYRAAHVGQIAELVLMQDGLYIDTNDKTVNFVVGFKNILANGTSAEYEARPLDTYTWLNSEIRSSFNTELYNALPQWLKKIIKTVKVTTGYYKYSDRAGDTNVTTIDKIFLAAEKEVFGISKNSTGNEASVLSQFEYYAVDSNRVKRIGLSSSRGPWWLRSPDATSATVFCVVGANGTATYGNSSSGSGLAPHFCI